VTALGVAFDNVVRRVVPEKAMSILSAALFIAIGVWLLVKELWLEE
jgi:putative Ca2+/H+ antiporter (TMEM165/GDT1 family)